jgi:hypothetical protein
MNRTPYQGEKMHSIKRTIAQRYAAHRQAMLVTAAVTGILLLSWLSPVLAAEPLKVGGLPVT